MQQLHDIKDLIKNCKIKLFHSPLPTNVGGTFYSDNTVSMIIMNNNLDTSSAKYKTILIEELGHYFTSVGDNTPKKHLSYSQKLRIDKSEEQAIRWACNYAIPDLDLLNQIKENKMRTIQDIAEHYNVTTEFVQQKLEFMNRVQCNWNIDETRTLVLSSLPSVYIYNRMED